LFKKTFEQKSFLYQTKKIFVLHTQSTIQKIKFRYFFGSYKCQYFFLFLNDDF